jgi:hypothetical protein
MPLWYIFAALMACSQKKTWWFLRPLSRCGIVVDLPEIGRRE